MFTFKKKAITEDAQFIIDIVSNYSSNKAVKKLISPISDEYFLIDDDNKISICINDGEVVLSNHTFLYTKVFNLSFTDKLKKLIRENMEAEMQLLKKSLFKNETQLLSKILDFSTKTPNLAVIKHNFRSFKKVSN